MGVATHTLRTAVLGTQNGSVDTQSSESDSCSKGTLSLSTRTHIRYGVKNAQM